ncbi:phospholipase-like protein [Tanacetum coccineum]
MTYKVTLRSRPSTIPFIKERLSKTNKRLKLFKDTVFGKYLDLKLEDNDNHLLNYVLHHQRPELSKSIDSNLVFDIAGHMLLFGRSEFCLVINFICGKVVFPEYMDDGIPPFFRCKAAKGKAAKDLRLLIWDDEKWKKLSVEDSICVYLLYMSEQIFMGQEDRKVVNNSLLRLVEDLVAWDDFSWGEYYWEEFYKKTVDDRDGFTHDDEPEVGQDRSGTSDKASARAKVEEIKSTREISLEEELDLWKSGYIKLESCYKNLEAYVEIDNKNSPRLSFPTPNAKATSVCDDVCVTNAAADDNENATSVYDDIDEADVVVDDNAKEVVSVADNGEVVKETQLLKIHERNKKGTLLSDCPPVIGNYLKEIHLARWEENLTRDSNAPKIRVHVDKEVLDYLNQAKKPCHMFPWGNGLNIDEKFRQSLVARDASSKGFLTLLVVELWFQLMWHFRPKHADWAISSPHYYNFPMLNDLGDWIFKDITYPMVYIHVNIRDTHWLHAEFKIRKGVVTFYDTLNDKKPWHKDDRP